MTWRQLRVLIQHLPPESATMTALRNGLTDEELDQQARDGKPEEGAWSMTDQLLAGAIDALREIQYTLVLANLDKKARKPRRPEPIRRPGVSRKQRQPMSEAAAEKLFTLINGGAA